MAPELRAVRTSLYYGAPADVQVKFLATSDDEAAAAAVAEVLARLGEVTGVRDAIDAAVKST